MKKRILFIDRDGTIIKEPPIDFQIDSLEKLSFIPGVITALSKIRASSNYEFVMVTNQDGLGTASFREETFWPAHDKMLETLDGEGVQFDRIFIDRSFDHENLPTRKPGTAMLTQYMTDEYDLCESYVIGDRLTDVQLAANLGAKAILFTNDASFQLPGNMDITPVLITNSWRDIARHLTKPNRTAKISRKTSETDIEILLNLDGEGAGKIETGIGFFDHLLEQISRHSGCDLSIKVTGDLYVDEHHTIEDTALALGEAIRKALGDKRGIERYGFTLPMDDCLCTVALDFGGRPWLVWDATFNREKIGDMPTEMFMHFFKSLSDSAMMNINIQATGTNEHHKIEGIFKALARAIKMAVKKDDSDNRLPSTKGVL